jgi:hypothetical protein
MENQAWTDDKPGKNLIYTPAASWKQHACEGCGLPASLLGFKDRSWTGGLALKGENNTFISLSFDGMALCQLFMIDLII